MKTFKIQKQSTIPRSGTLYDVTMGVDDWKEVYIDAYICIIYPLLLSKQISFILLYMKALQVLIEIT